MSNNASRTVALDILKKERDDLADVIRNQHVPEKKVVSIYRLNIIDKTILVLEQEVEEEKLEKSHEAS